MVGKSRFYVEDLHAQIADELIRQIARGELVSGSFLSQDNALAEEFGVSVGTIRRSLERLSDLGLIDRGKGRLTRVLDVEEARRNSKLIAIRDKSGNRIEGEARQSNVRREDPGDGIRWILEYHRPGPVLRFDRHRYHVGRCFAREDVYVPLTTEEASAGDSRLDEIASRLWWDREIAQNKEERIWCEHCGEEDADLFGCPPDHAVLRIDRTLYGSRRRPLEYSSGRYALSPDLVYLTN